MSTEAGPKGKGGRAPANANNDADSIMPLLFATIGNPAISFKKMAAMDELGRTESSLEHKFRKWRQKGREIGAENPENAGNLGAASAGAAITKKPRTPAKKGASGTGKGPAKQSYVGDEEDEEDEIEETGTVKQEPDEKVILGLTDVLTRLTSNRAASPAAWYPLLRKVKSLRPAAPRSVLPLKKLPLRSTKAARPLLRKLRW